LVLCLLDLLSLSNRPAPTELYTLSLHDALPIFAFVLIRDILHKEHGQHIVFVLTGIHTAAQLVAAGPKGGVKFGFLNGHGCSLQDRKSTRLNSSHVKISYAVFCLKKKKLTQQPE